MWRPSSSTADSAGQLDQAQAHGGGDRLELGVRVQFLDDALNVVAHRGQADAEVQGDRLIGQALRKQTEDLGFARCEIRPRLRAVAQAVEEAAQQRRCDERLAVERSSCDPW